MLNKKIVKKINSVIFLNVIFDEDLTQKDHLGTSKKKHEKYLNPVQSYIPERSPKHLLFYMHTLIMETKDRIALVKKAHNIGFQTPASNKDNKLPHQKTSDKKLNAFKIWNNYIWNFVFRVKNNTMTYF